MQGLKDGGWGWGGMSERQRVGLDGLRCMVSRVGGGGGEACRAVHTSLRVAPPATPASPRKQSKTQRPMFELLLAAATSGCPSTSCRLRRGRPPTLRSAMLHRASSPWYRLLGMASECSSRRGMEGMQLNRRRRLGGKCFFWAGLWRKGLGGEVGGRGLGCL